MKLKNSIQDISQWNEYHSIKSTNGLIAMKQMMHDGLVSAIDSFEEIIEQNRAYEARLKEYLTRSGLSEGGIEAINVSIHKFQLETKITSDFANFYLVLLDINTYAYNIFLAKDDWEWRVFARHIFTVLYEHKNSISPLINGFIKNVKEEFGTQYDFNPLINAKKELVKVIEEISEYAKTIRVNVDAHFDGDFEERLRLIEEMSYSSIVRILYNYWSKASAFLHEVTPIVYELQKDVKASLHEIECKLTAIIEKNL